ncbi:hypothetical protein [Methanoregula sp.]|uniref:hypothetical protein n=1 Tax=Methanoregula sp. TaxID=2052170 RepID=UPI003BAEBBD9
MPEPALAPPCPERGPEAGRPHTRAHYFKHLNRTILQYLDHAEHKYDGDEGFLERKHIVVSEVVHIGKEANNIEDEPLDGGKVQVFRDEERERQRTVEMRQCDAERLGVNRGTRWRMRNKAPHDVTYN